MKNLLVLKKYFLKYRNKLLLGVLFIIISNLSGVYVPILIKDGINSLNSKIDDGSLLRFGILIVVISLFSGFFRVMIRQTIIVVSREIEFDLRNDFWKHLQSLPVSYYHNNKTGSIMAHATNDISAVRNFAGPAVMYTIDTFTIFVFTVVIMISISPMLTFLSMIPFPVLSVIVYKVGKKIHKRFTSIQEHFSVLTAKAQENLSGIRIIKAYVKESKEIDAFKKLSNEYFQKNMKLAQIQSMFFPLLFLVIGTSMVIIMWYGGIKVMNGSMKLGDIIAFILYLGYLIWPAIAVGWVTNLVQQAEASQKRLNNIFDIKSEIVNNNQTDFSIKSIQGSIEFKNVSFRYSENLPYILKNINLFVPKGSSLAIIGQTGCGKSTLVNLILRMYDIKEGEILIDGKNIKEIPIEVIRGAIGYVSQETFLFSDTIKNNITFGLDNFSIEEFNKAIKTAQLDKDIESFNEKSETIIGERGITLSGGQKQRTTIARAVIKNPEILILDDCLSAVDTYTEEEILKNLKKELKQRTGIIISHRISTVKDADKIIVLKNGVITEEGKHEDLIKDSGFYAEIYGRQLLEKELEEIN